MFVDEQTIQSLQTQSYVRKFRQIESFNKISPQMYIVDS
jgi:hypothetical protein